MTLTLVQNNSICSASVNYGTSENGSDVFVYTRKNINVVNVSYQFTHVRKNKCKVQLHFKQNIKNGVVDHQNIDLVGENTRACCIINTVDPNNYHWEGKRPDDESPSKVQDDESPSKFQNIVQNRPKFVDVSEEMVQEVDALCTANLTLPPLNCWGSIRQSMDLKYPSGWAENKKIVITDQVRRSCYNLNHGIKFRTVENTSYRMMTDTNRPFLQHDSIVPDREKSGKYQRMMVVGNPTLFGILRANFVDLYMDATFNFCPDPFYQCLIIMIFDRATNKYVPIL